MSAVRKYFQVNGVDVTFLKDSHYIQNTKAGMLNAYRITLNRDVKDNERLYISIGMIQDYDAYLRQSLPTYGVVHMLLNYWAIRLCLVFLNIYLYPPKLNTCWYQSVSYLKWDLAV